MQLQVRKQRAEDVGKPGLLHGQGEHAEETGESPHLLLAILFDHLQVALLTLLLLGEINPVAQRQGRAFYEITEDSINTLPIRQDTDGLLHLCQVIIEVPWLLAELTHLQTELAEDVEAVRHLDLDRLDSLFMAI
jgi:hypothetical protein